MDATLMHTLPLNVKDGNTVVVFIKEGYVTSVNDNVGNQYKQIAPDVFAAVEVKGGQLEITTHSDKGEWTKVEIREYGPQEGHAQD